MPTAPDIITALCAKIGYDFCNDMLLAQALLPAASQGQTNNERLEFLGDRVAGLVLAEALYQQFPKENEGDLAKRHAALVQGPVMRELAIEISLDKALSASAGIPTDTMLADAFEALVGAIYLDSGFATTRDVVLRLWGDRITSLSAPPQDPKTALQEWAQARSLPTPSYEIIAREGQDHAPIFTIGLKLQGQPDMQAKGKSRREAEKLAAQAMLDRLTQKP